MESNEYLNCVRVIIYGMKMFGVFPFILLHRGTKISFLMCNLLTLLSLLLYTLVIPNQLLFMYNTARLIIVNFNFTFFVRNIPFILFRVTLIILPFVMWNKNVNLYSYWTNWMHFQKEMEKTIGHPFSSSVKNTIRWISILGIGGISFGVVFVRYRIRNHAANFISFVSTLYVTILLTVIVIYWFINNLYVNSVAKQLAKMIRKAIREKNAAKLQYLIDLWLMLCNLNDQFNKSHSILFLLHLSFSIVNSVASGYSFLFLLLTESDRTLCIPFLYVNTICFYCILAFCESANSLSKHIINKMKEALLCEQITNRKSALLQTIFLFLQTIETRNPRVTLNGYLHLNRSTITTIFAAIISFLVVLRQFSIM